MPLPLIALILAAAAALAVIVLAIIYYDDIIAWFKARNDIKLADKENIAFTIKEKLASGDFKVVQGIFNKRSESIVDGQAMQTKELDAEFDAVHESNDLVLYE